MSWWQFSLLHWNENYSLQLKSDFSRPLQYKKNTFLDLNLEENANSWCKKSSNTDSPTNQLLPPWHFKKFWMTSLRYAKSLKQEFLFTSFVCLYVKYVGFLWSKSNLWNNLMPESKFLIPTSNNRMSSSGLICFKFAR